MGEHADDAINRMLGGVPRRPLQREQNAAKCNRCGSTAVHWRETGVRWALFDDARQYPGNRFVLHDCPAAVADASEFD